MKVLVTGGAGFIGSHLVRALLAAGHEVSVIDNLSTGRFWRLEDLVSELNWMEADIRDPDACARATEGVEVVLHQAAVPSVARSINDPTTSHDVNVTGSHTLLLACRASGVRRVVFASSAAVYGSGPELPKVETCLPAPMSPYAANKIAVEHYLKVFAELGWIEAVPLRYFNVFGPMQDPAAEYAAAIPKFIRAMLENRPVTVFGDGAQSRDFTFVENIVQANLRAMDAPVSRFEPFNVGCGKGHDVNSLVAELASLIGVQPNIESHPPRPGDVRHSFADTRRAQDVLGYAPNVDFREGLRRTVEWFRTQQRTS